MCASSIWRYISNDILYADLQRAGSQVGFYSFTVTISLGYYSLYYHTLCQTTGLTA